MADTLPLDTILHGDCLAVLRTLPDASVDAIVTDPPYGLGEAPDMAAVLGAWLAGEQFVPRNRGGFMGKAWDAFVPGPEYWRAAYRVLKPGGHLLAFAGTRTEDVMGISIRLAGFERRDTLYWIHGQGFPKSLDIGKHIDKRAGARRQVVGVKKLNERDKVAYIPHAPSHFGMADEGKWAHEREITAPATDAAKQWDGWGTALKPAVEPIILARKPLSEPSIAANVLRWGTGALNIEASRVPGEAWGRSTPHRDDLRGGTYGANNGKRIEWAPQSMPQAGRWPPHLLLSHSLFCTAEACAEGCPVRELGRQSGERTSGSGIKGKRNQLNTYGQPTQDLTTHWAGDTGTAARYFPQFRYVAKASRAERNRGCEGLPITQCGVGALRDGGRGKVTTNHHPTVKPVALMRWLVRLVCPPGGIVLDPFAGSGTTCLAAQQLGMHWLGIEQSAEYVAIARARLGMPQEEVSA